MTGGGAWYPGLLRSQENTRAVRCFLLLPFRLREGSGEGYLGRVLVGLPSPNPSRKREGDCVVVGVDVRARTLPVLDA